MSVIYLLYFAVCQANYVQANSITLPMTYLTYTFQSTIPKEVFLKSTLQENIQILNNPSHREKIITPKIILQPSPFESGFSAEPNNLLTTPISHMLQPQKESKIENMSQIKNLKQIQPSMSTTPQVTMLPGIHFPINSESYITNNKMSINNYTHNFALTGSTEKAGCNTNSPSALNVIPTSYKANSLIKQDIFRQAHPKEEICPTATDQRRLQESKLITEQKYNQKQKSTVANETSNRKFKLDEATNFSQQQYIDCQQDKLKVTVALIEKNPPHYEVPFTLCPNEHGAFNIGPYNVSSFILPVFYPKTSKENTIVHPVHGNKVESRIKQSIKFENSNMDVSPGQFIKPEYKNVATIKSVAEKSYIPVVATTSYTPEELPNTLQLPQAYANPKLASLYLPSNGFPKDSTSVNEKQNTFLQFVANPSWITSYLESNKAAMDTSAFTTAVNYIPSTTTKAPPLWHIVSGVPTSSELHKLYPNAGVTYPPVPTNLKSLSFPSIGMPKSSPNITPSNAFNSEVTAMKPTINTENIPIKQIIKKSSLNPNAVMYSPYISLPSNSSATLPSRESLLGPIIDTPLLCNSTLSESLNKLVSSFTTGFLSVFHNLTQSSSESVDSILTNAPSSIYNEKSISHSMPVFILRPPEIQSPTFLPSPNLGVLSHDVDDIFSLKFHNSPISKIPKAYISCLAINVVPQKEKIDEIIIIV